eukprot:TRINITY_DN54173_c0_g1_i1.p2 TRINITY_DN54173_c0_g1~~TRINITY_DN54173_c0_g1_i1.p2  ORF type:complete len:142 (-),score=17.66 TRINITY_DN54173_c0_g1_i1:55-480(-)
MRRACDAFDLKNRQVLPPSAALAHFTVLSRRAVPIFAPSQALFFESSATEGKGEEGVVVAPDGNSVLICSAVKRETDKREQRRCISLGLPRSQLNDFDFGPRIACIRLVGSTAYLCVGGRAAWGCVLAVPLATLLAPSPTL